MRRRPLSESRPWRLLRVRGGLRVLRLVGSVVVMSVLPGVVLSADRYELLLMHHLLVLILFVQLAAAFWRSNCLMDVQSRKLPLEKGTNKGRVPRRVLPGIRALPFRYR